MAVEIKDPGVAPKASQARRPMPLVRRTEWVVGATPSSVRLRRELGPDTPALTMIFAGGAQELARSVAAFRLGFPGGQVIGCTTAGEIGDRGYRDGSVVALALPASHFAVHLHTITPLGAMDPAGLARHLAADHADLAARRPEFAHEFALSLVDGLSMMEDRLATTLGRALGPIPQVGGSAADGRAFRTTAIADGAAISDDRAVVALVRAAGPVRVFCVDHLRPTDTRMVVTDADPARRLVRELNGVPAAAEYARLVGRRPDELDDHAFAAHPVVVRLNGDHHVRAIQRRSADGGLIFYSAIDAGVVLSLAEPGDLVGHLSDELEALSAQGTAPAAVVGFDCVLRRTEATGRQATGAVSDLLSRHRVAGFSTYGEQVAGRHVNQTLTGVALYPPAPSP